MNRIPLMLALVPATLADEVRLIPVQDTTLYESPTGDLGNGAGEYMFVGLTAQDDVRRCLFTFDVAGQVPKGATIDSVTLELFMSKTIAATHEFGLHRVTQAWGEGASDALLEEGGGTAAERDDATWLHTFYPSEFWAAPGGDYEPTASAVFPIGDVGKYFLTDPGLDVDVQAWADDATPNHGWLMRQVDESLSTTAKRFSTREAGVDFFKPTLVINFTIAEVGTNYCGPAVNNSSGLPGRIRALGSDVVADNGLTLRAEDLPPGQFGYFLNSQSQGFVQNPGGSQGDLCLSGAIGRYVAQVGNSGAAGTLQVLLDLTNTPTPGGLVAIQPGETWHFTGWYRDQNPGTTSNFTDGTSVTFN